MSSESVCVAEKGETMLGQILRQLRSHAPFTIFGALSGIVFMLVFRNISYETSHTLFYVFHPIHVVLSAMVTASMYRLHTCERVSGKCLRGGCNLWVLLIIGYVGSIGIATLSDSVIPYLGETLLQMPHRHVHIGFIEEWWLINPAAILGIAIAYFWPATKFPHAGHVLLSTWASIFHITMAKSGALDPLSYAVIFVFLFLAVWLPCCVSDIVFPLLFVKPTKKA